MTYKVQFAPRAERQLFRFPATVQLQLVKRADDLAANPRPSGVMKLTGQENRWRIRAGNSRLIYEIHDDVLVVLVVAVGHHREVYRHG